MKRGQEDVVLDTKIDAEISNRASAVNVEKVRAEAAETALQLQISNILSNSDTTALNSLAEIVASFQAADQNLTTNVASHNTRLDAVEALMDQLLNQ